MTQRTAHAVLRLLFGLLVLIAVGWQFKIHISLNYPAVNFFSYFTNLANLFAAGVLLLSAAKYLTGSEPTASTDQLRLMSTTNMVVVGIVFTTLLRNVELGSLLPWINILLHYVMPVVVILDWFFDPPRTKLETTHIKAILILPAAYLAYTLLRGSSTGWYPYPFLNPSVVGSYATVAMYAVGISVTFLLTGWQVIVAGNKRRVATG